MEVVGVERDLGRGCQTRNAVNNKGADRGRGREIVFIETRFFFDRGRCFFKRTDGKKGRTYLRRFFSLFACKSANTPLCPRKEKKEDKTNISKRRIKKIKRSRKSEREREK